jgi:16S rRNA (guanine1207-N2)-methyltransferase
MSRSLIYGDIPAGLVEVPHDGVQVSPLHPGAVTLDTLKEGSHAGLVMRAPANTIERRHEIALALRALAPGAPLTILAPKDKGGTRLAKDLMGFGVMVSDQPKRHHRICQGPRPEALRGIEAALTEGALRSLPDLGFWGQPGLFSWDRLDAGSKALMDVLPPLSGKVADFGCGAGVLSQVVLQSPKVSSVTGFELDRRAIAAAHKTTHDPRFSSVWVDLVATGAPGQSFDAIVMNPPFHRAGIEDQALGMAMIIRAAEALRPGGSLWLTANRHLPYEATLKARFASFTLKSEAQGFKVYQAIR